MEEGKEVVEAVEVTGGRGGERQTGTEGGRGQVCEAGPRTALSHRGMPAQHSRLRLVSRASLRATRELATIT